MSDCMTVCVDIVRIYFAWCMTVTIKNTPDEQANGELQKK